MRKSKLSFLQYPSLGGDLNTLPTTYKISKTPIGDENKWGYLAYVSDNTRKKIMASGFGEMQAHIEHIKNQVGRLQKIKTRHQEEQGEIDV